MKAERSIGVVQGREEEAVVGMDCCGKQKERFHLLTLTLY